MFFLWVMAVGDWVMAVGDWLMAIR